MGLHYCIEHFECDNNQPSDRRYPTPSSDGHPEAQRDQSPILQDHVIYETSHMCVIELELHGSYTPCGSHVGHCDFIQDWIIICLSKPTPSGLLSYRNLC